jgi:hypothetical protein
MKLAAFLGALAVTGSVRAAAQRVGMARETAYRLRRRPGAASFARAWDAVLRRPTAPSPKVTPEELAQRAVHGLLKPLIYAGPHVATVPKPDNSSLLRFLGLAQRRRFRGDEDAAAVGSFVPRSGSTSGWAFRPVDEPGRGALSVPSTRACASRRRRAGLPARRRSCR